MIDTNYISSNKAAWNEVDPVQHQLSLPQLLANFQDPNYSCLDTTLTNLFQEIGIENKIIGQLGCSNGRELLSVQNLGAKRSVGVDISEKFIGQANALADVAQTDTQFICSDIHQISAEYNHTFDLIFITAGVLGWMPRVQNFFHVVKRLLKPDGSLLIYEMHPILDMFDLQRAGTIMKFHHSYFREKPHTIQVEQSSEDEKGIAPHTMYWFHHKMSDIITSCLTSGLTLRLFQEYQHDISNVLQHFEQSEFQLPLSYALIASVVDG